METSNRLCQFNPEFKVLNHDENKGAVLKSSADSFETNFKKSVKETPISQKRMGYFGKGIDVNIDDCAAIDGIKANVENTVSFENDASSKNESNESNSNYKELFKGKKTKKRVSGGVKKFVTFFNAKEKSFKGNEIIVN
jgi:hypothetical protein